MRVTQIDQFFKQNEVFFDGPHARANHDAVVAPGVEESAHNHFRRSAKIGQAQFCIITKTVEPSVIGLERGKNLVGCDPRKRCSEPQRLGRLDARQCLYLGNYAVRHLAVHFHQRNG